MPKGKQGAPEGLAKAFVAFVRTCATENGWSLETLAGFIGKSKGYVAPRMRGEAIFTVQDFENFANAIQMDPQELLARVQFPPAAHYEGRLIPRYGIEAGTNGMTIYRAEDADPQPRASPDNVVHGRFGVGGPLEDLEVAAETNIDHDEDTDDYTP